jgi:hypothetical protein
MRRVLYESSTVKERKRGGEKRGGEGRREEGRGGKEERKEERCRIT